MKKVLIALVTLMFLFTGCSDSPEDVAVEYTKAVYNGDIDKVMELIYMPKKERKKVGTEDQVKGKLQMMLGEIKSKAAQHKGVKNIKVSQIENNSEDKTKALVHLKVTFNDAYERQERVGVVKNENGDWKVQF